MEEPQLHLTFRTPTPQEPVGRVWDQPPGVQMEESLSGVQAENLPRGFPGTPGSLTSGVSDSCSSCRATDGCSGLSPMARLPGRESACRSCPAARVTLVGTSYLLNLGQPCATSWVLTWTCQDSRCVDTGTQRSLLTPRVDGSGALEAGVGVLGLPPYLEGPKAQDPQKKCSDGLALQNCPQWGAGMDPRSQGHGGGGGPGPGLPLKLTPFPPPWPLPWTLPHLLQGAMPAQGWGSQAGQRPSLPTHGLWVLPARPPWGLGGFKFASLGGSRGTESSLLHLLPLPLSAPPQQLGSDAEEVCLASHATSVVAPLPPPRPHPPKFPSDTQLRSQPLIIPPGPPHTLCLGRQSDPTSAA